MPHPHMIFDIDECEEYSSIPDKTTVIVTTGQAPINFLMWNIFSFLLRSKMNDYMEHIIVSINGPDKRSGDPTLQDNKQKFLEELRDMKWKKADGEKDMPLTVIRAWSRVGADQAVEMACAWVHTQDYLLTHDDSILVERDWEAEVRTRLHADPKIATAYFAPEIQGHLCSDKFQEQWKLNIPHINSVFFLACKKAAIAKAGVRWAGFHFKKEFDIREITNTPELFEFYKKHLFHGATPQTEEQYHWISQDFGAWMHYRLSQEGYYGVPFQKKLIHHFGSASWGGDDHIKWATSQPAGNAYVQALEKELEQHPEYLSLYNKYKTKL